ncbi:MAG: hypothetical protein HY560_10190, partial [Gemmatimonadetes bacterium]|nr:hypothetical protein [Gemmatimonadota bacterium]
LHPILFGLATLSLAVASCKDHGPESFDPMLTSQNAAQAFGAVQNNQAVQSLGVMGNAFTLTGAAPPQPLAAPLNAPPALLSTLRLVERVATAFSPANPADLFPTTVRGKTFVYNQQTGKYEPSDRTGAPANGVRFILYAVDPVLNRVVTPLQEIGTLDLTDKGNNTLGIKAVVNGVTMLEYDAGASVAASSFTFTAKGYVSNGTARLDFDLSLSLSPATGLRVDYTISAAGKDLSFHLVATGTTAGLGNITLTIKDSGNTLEISASGTSTSISGTIKYNNSTVATISGNPDNPTFTGADGRVLTEQDLEGLKQLVNFVDDLFDGFDDLLFPSFFVFGISQ